jgi:hypothetical protein
MGLVGAGLGLVGGKKLIDPTPIAGPKIVTDQGETISGWTPMVQNKAAGYNPDFAYVVKRASEKPSKMDSQYIKGFISGLKQAEIHDAMSPFIGPNLDFDKVAQTLERDTWLKRAHLPVF